MINKKNVLGKEPEELGKKDAIHTAIVAVMAGGPIEPGERCDINKDRTWSSNSKGPGVADPFRKGTILRGKPFWLLLAQDEVPNVQHHWEHPEIDFTPPKERSYNRTIKAVADEYGLTYEQVMEAADYVVKHDSAAPFPDNSTKTEEELEAVYFDRYDFWSEWAEETCYKFEDFGSACCPEVEYPRCGLFNL